MNKFWLPRVFGNATWTSQGVPSSRAEQFAAWWLYRLGDKRNAMRQDARLVIAAQRQADWLAVNDFVPGAPHVGENGLTPNERVRLMNYRLPAWHGDGNTVESVSRSWDPVHEVVDDLMAHETHHDHLWCIGFWEPSVFYGVGYADQYYVIVTCPPEED